ncbi:C2 domain-containing protein [Psidium guajava]|nr:C2 domain-containing protein [Psidium guajava]
MDSFARPSAFGMVGGGHCDGDGGGDASFAGVLEVHVHHARNIHNICIYDNQDVYAKFSLTYSPDEALSTHVACGGGKNPEFNETLVLEVTQPDAVLKCEVWMRSRAQHLMEDQLLGFALVPLSQIAGNGKVTREYSLSSTDLFHSPAGTVRLGLQLTASAPIESAPNSSISSEVVLLDRKISEVILDPVEYSKIEFPEISVVRENQKMVSEYFDLASQGSTSSSSKPNSNGGFFGSFLHLGSSPTAMDDCEMGQNHALERCDFSISPDGSGRNSGFLSSTTTSLSDDRNSAESSVEKKARSGSASGIDASNSANPEASHGCGACPDTPTSKKACEIIKIMKAEKEECDSEEGAMKRSTNEEGNANANAKMDRVKFGHRHQVFSQPATNMNLEAEQSAMQQQIVDMYMRSMQQFTESLAKMKLPMDIDKPEIKQDLAAAAAAEIQTQKGKLDLDNNNSNRKDQSRVFYGSRAFF